MKVPVCWQKVAAGALVTYLLMSLYYNTIDARKWFKERRTVEGAIDVGPGNPLFGRLKTQ